MISRADLGYELPPELIAQSPAAPRDSSRLLLVSRREPEIEELRFRELPERLGPNDLLVANDTRVLPAKLRGHKASGGRAEALLIGRRPDGRWNAFLRCRGRLRSGLSLHFGEWRARVVEVGENGRCRLELSGPAGESIEDRLAETGEAPLPAYIRRDEALPADLGDYQTVYARRPGAIAAPTAGLHFTPELRARVPLAFVTLHVGPGTFAPLRCERLEDHALEAERFEVPSATAEAIVRTREAGGRVVAVGTTSVRALETTGGEPGSGRTELFIAPGFEFRVVDELITNFHLPGSSLLALVMAFGGTERVRRAYAHAIGAGFRFYSYGDAMWVR